MKIHLERLVVIESPFKGENDSETKLNILYAKACVKDSLSRGEYPYASHLFYTQDGILNDKNPIERELGIDAGFAWGKLANKRIIYFDRGVSEGMIKGIDFAKSINQKIGYRKLPNYEIFLEAAKEKISKNSYNFNEKVH